MLLVLDTSKITEFPSYPQKIQTCIYIHVMWKMWLSLFSVYECLEIIQVSKDTSDNKQMTVS